MGRITNIQGSLFEAPAGAILIHSCNCQGMWGSGIAKEFAVRFPIEYRLYTRHCKITPKVLGTALLIHGSKYSIGCLFTSFSYGAHVDSPSKILQATKTAITDLIRQNTKNQPFHACKFNSGLFKVPWEDTLAILETTGRDFTIHCQ